MLDKLFGSNARVKLLKLFLLHPNERFYIREIARELDLQLNSVFRELNNLEDLGLLCSETCPEGEGEFLVGEEASIVVEATPQTKRKTKEKQKQDRKYYRVNTDFLFYNEIKALIVKSQMLYEKDFTEKLKKIGNIKLLILTGSFVNKPDSNVDLFVVGQINKSKLIKIVEDLESELVKEINYSIMEETEFNYRREIADVFLYNILDGEKIVVVDHEHLLL
ncbi:MAG: hypothetical protein PHR00_04155 [Patescibacteria group bacterium]|nr:hypothetical protein [Patescibacteria group bacterium]